MKKSIKIFFPILTAAVIFTGCSISEPPTAQPEQNQASESATTPSSSTTDQQQQQQPTEDKQQEQPAEDQKSTEATGEYVGQIDSNSIEITVDGSPKAFVLNEESATMIGALKTGSKVSIIYTENEHGQLILNKIEIAK